VTSPVPGDWKSGTTSYDHWTTNPRFFEQRLNNGNPLKSLKKHVNGIKTDYAVIDTIGLNDAQRAKLKDLISSLTPAERARIIDRRGTFGTIAQEGSPWQVSWCSIRATGMFQAEDSGN
jgi:hypothetical protein